MQLSELVQAAEQSADVAVADVAEMVAEPVVRPAKQKRKKPKRQPRYNVILWNDDDHSFEYVIAMMAKLFGFPAPQGFQIAETVHRHGKAIVLTTTLEHAELKRDQIHAYGKDVAIAGCQGSMSSTIEAVS